MFLGTLKGLLLGFNFQKTGYSIQGLKKAVFFLFGEYYQKLRGGCDIVLQPMLRYTPTAKFQIMHQ